MFLRYFPVRTDLGAFFGAYYAFQAPAGAYQPICAELGNIRFILSGGGELIWSDGRRQPAPEAAVVGPTMGAYAVSVEPGSRVFGVGLQPAGWDALFSFGADRLSDRMEALCACLDVGPAPVAVLLDAMRGAQSGEACAALADRFFGALVARRLGQVRMLPPAFEAWLLDPASPGVEALLERLELSARQADRLANHFYGAPPKALHRKYRALHALSRISLEDVSHWYDASGEGYYDQSHFIREFKTFVGATPRAFLKDAPILMSRSIRLRARAMHRRPLEGRKGMRAIA